MLGKFSLQFGPFLATFVLVLWGNFADSLRVCVLIKDNHSKCNRSPFINPFKSQCYNSHIILYAMYSVFLFIQ